MKEIGVDIEKFMNKRPEPAIVPPEQPKPFLRQQNAWSFDQDEAKPQLSGLPNIMNMPSLSDFKAGLSKPGIKPQPLDPSHAKDLKQKITGLSHKQKDVPTDLQRDMFTSFHQERMKRVMAVLEQQEPSSFFT